MEFEYDVENGWGNPQVNGRGLSEKTVGDQKTQERNIFKISVPCEAICNRYCNTIFMYFEMLVMSDISNTHEYIHTECQYMRSLG